MLNFQNVLVFDYFFANYRSNTITRVRALPRLVSAIWFSLGWCIVQQGGRQRGFINHLDDAI